MGSVGVVGEEKEMAVWYKCRVGESGAAGFLTSGPGRRGVKRGEGAKRVVSSAADDAVGAREVL